MYNYCQYSGTDGEGAGDCKKNETEDEFIEKMQEAFRNCETITRKLAHIMLVGPPGSGKSSLMDRLLYMPMRNSNIPTDVAEEIVAVEVILGEKTSTSHIANVRDCKWEKLCFNDSFFYHVSQMFSEKEAVLDVQSLYEALSVERGNYWGSFRFRRTRSLAKTPSATVPDKLHSKLSQDGTTPQASNKAEKDIPDAPMLDQSMISYLRGKYGNYRQFKESMEEGISLYLRDTGGHIEFQEMLPLLIFGPSIFFFVFRIDLPLNKQFRIEYRQRGSTCKPYESSISIEDALLKCLATVDARRLEKGESQQVFIIATHTDILKKKIENEKGPSVDKKICDISRYLYNLIEAHELLHLISYAENDPDHAIFTVDNTSKDEKDFDVIRLRISNIIKDRPALFNFEYPINYLLFCLDLNMNCEKTILDLSEFEKMASKFQIQSNALSKLLYFLCDKIGIIQHFDINEAKHIVVLKPEFLYTTVSNFVIETFQSMKALPLERQDFEKKGILTPTVAKSVIGEGKILSASDLLELLVQLRIIARFKDGNYFIPCILNRLPYKELKAPKQEEKRVEPLYICFKRNYCPNGLFPVVVTYFMSHKERETPADIYFEFNQEGVSKDQVSFSVMKSDDSSNGLLSLKVVSGSYLEVNFFAIKHDRSMMMYSCQTIRSDLEKYLDMSLVDLKYNKDIVKYKLHLKCWIEDCQELHEVLDIK